MIYTFFNQTEASVGQYHVIQKLSSCLFFISENKILHFLKN
jgi:hypothetical protein